MVKNEQSCMPNVSVIVPVYNVESYLEKCLESLRQQTLKNIEVIIVNDGSTDRSGNICNAFAEADSRFRVLHKKNEGLSAARNAGLELAKAEYIMFVDSDDWVKPKFCEIPYFAAVNNDVPLVAFRYIQYGKRTVKKQPPFPMEGVFSKETVLTRLWQLTGTIAWNKLYKKDLFEGIRYPEGHFFEDGAVTHRLIFNANNIVLLNQYLYNYRDYRSGSITNTRSINYYTDAFVYGFERVADLKQWGYDYKEAEERVALQYLVVMGRHGELSSKCINILRKSNHFIGHSIFWKQKVMFLIYRLSPLLFDFISIVTGKRVKKNT